MKYTNLNENIVIEEKEKKFLKFLYNTKIGRILLKVISLPFISKIIGYVLDTRISNVMTKYYIKKYNIKLEEYESQKYKSFNDFFTRKLKKIKKSENKNHFISIADSKIMCYKIEKDLIINIKNSKYSIEELIKDKEIAKEYENGLCLIYRLAPNNYHRYIFCDDGIIKSEKKILGKLHTVDPIVYDKYNVFTENTRVVSELETKTFGNIINIEVGALCVGKINNHNKKQFKRYEEKGFFEFGGSTIIQLIKKGNVSIKKEIIENTNNDIETKVKIGDIIGTRI